jgi:hypothetical protein
MGIKEQRKEKKLYQKETDQQKTRRTDNETPATPQEITAQKDKSSKQQ